MTKLSGFNDNWKFYLGDLDDGSALDMEDVSWQTVNLPHDWSIGFSYDQTNGEGCTAYLLGGIGWYRKEVTLSKETIDEISFLLFDGIYNYAEIYVNGLLVGNHDYGYSPFQYYISEFLTEGTNVIAVRVDHSRYADSRWYTGSGIYREAQLVTVPRTYIPIWGTYLTTPMITKEQATVALKVTVNNIHIENVDIRLETSILDKNETQVAEISQMVTLKPSSNSIDQELLISQPELWSTESPVSYKAVTKIILDEKVIQSYETPFGIRTIRFDNATGFWLNDQNMKIKGVCLHHDGGLVGAAVPDGVWRRRLSKLKEGGCNAIRTAHNPSSEAFLNLCDAMGFLVQVEFYDEWDHAKDKRLNMKDQHDDFISRSNPKAFGTWAEEELKQTMLRDRNHPCVFQWSIGNEIEWTYPKSEKSTGYFGADANGNYFWERPPYDDAEIRENFNSMPKDEFEIGETAGKLAKWTKEMDLTRPVIANCILPSASYVSGYAEALDIIGFSYRQIMYDYGHENYPELPIMGAENLGQWHEWMHVMKRPFISGMFIWTGVDYLGEARDNWPKKGSGSGLLDFAGFEKPSYHMMKTLWSETPHLHLDTSTLERSIYDLDSEGYVVEKKEGAWKERLWRWHDVNQHWNYNEGDQVVVECLTNCDSVELFLEGRSYGIRTLMDNEDRVLKWMLPYRSGEVKAVGIKDGRSISETLVTAGVAHHVILSAEETILKADASDVAHIIAQVMDVNDHKVLDREVMLTFDVTGPCKVLGIDNGAVDNVQDHNSQTIMTSGGRALLIIQSTYAIGNIEVSVRSESLDADRLCLVCE